MKKTGNAWGSSVYPTPETDAGYGMALGDIDGLLDVVTTNLGFSSASAVFVLHN